MLTFHTSCCTLCCFLQLFNSVDASELDLDDTPDHAGANLMSTRHEAWQELCIAKANELRKKADRSAATIAAIEQQMDSEVLSGNRPLDRLAMVKLQQEDLRRKIAVEKAELQKLVVVTQAAAPPAQPTAGAAAPAGMAGKAPVAAAAVQQQVVPNALALQQIQNLQVQMMQRQNLMQQLAQQQQLQGGLQPAQVQQYLLLQQQNQQAQAAMQQALLQQQMLQQAAKKQ